MSRFSAFRFDLSLTARIARYSVVVYLILVPWTAVWLPLYGHTYARIASVLVGAVCTLHIGHMLWNNPCVPLSPMWRLWLVAVGALATAAVFHAPVPLKAVEELAVWLGCVAIAITFACAINVLDVRRLGQAVLAAVLFYNSIALLIPVGGMLLGSYPVNVSELPLGYENRRFFNHVQTVAIPLTVVALFQLRRSKLWPVVAWASLITGFTLLFLTGGRGTFVGLAAAVLLSPAWLGRSTWHGVRPLLLATLGGYFAYLILFVYLPDTLNLANGQELTQRATEVGSIQARLLLWQVAVNYIDESPWLGIGPMHFAHRLNWEAAHPHNIYLQIGAEWGLPMLALLLVGVFAGLSTLVRTTRKVVDVQDKLVGGALAMAFVAVLVDGCVSGNFVMPVSQIWIAAGVGGVAGWVRANAQAQHPVVEATAFASITVRLLSFALVLIQLLQVGLVAHELPSSDEMLRRFEALSGNDHLSPRFWVNGWF